jgi:pimeloyl-ACP methyl ester carboxylesterase
MRARAQLLGLWILTKATPQMGLFDHSMLDIPYARNFYDSDQRPLRGILRRLEQPTLIIHGTHDDLVPYDAHWNTTASCHRANWSPWMVATLSCSGSHSISPPSSRALSIAPNRHGQPARDLDA